MKTDFEHLEEFRTTTGEFASPPGSTFGAFAIPNPKVPRERFIVICDDGTGPIQTGWEHVSVRLVVDPELRMSRCPTWYEMQTIKNLFWEKNEVVMQFHIDDDSKVNVHPSVLHLWRPVDGQFPLPDSKMV